VGYAVVLVTTPSQEEGKAIARAILERRLAACVNLIPKVYSSFWWEGKLEEAEESMLVIKTKEEAVPRLAQEVQRLHSYSVCEVIALPLTQGNQSYLDWIEGTVQP
jgi:periplasmic divalent cation tolerance protein